MRHIARPASVVIRTVGDDAVAWDPARGVRLLLPPLHARMLAGIPSQWISEEEVADGDQRIAGCSRN